MWHVWDKEKNILNEYMEKDEDNLEEFMGWLLDRKKGMLKESMGKEKNM